MNMNTDVPRNETFSDAELGKRALVAIGAMIIAAAAVVGATSGGTNKINDGTFLIDPNLRPVVVDGGDTPQSDQSNINTITLP